MQRFAPGQLFGKFKKKRIREVAQLSDGWYLLKTDDTKSPRDFLVKTVYGLDPLRYLTPKHAHFAIDFYGKTCADKAKANKVLNAVVSVWQGEDVRKILNQYQQDTCGLPGYSLEYVLYALRWILEQEDANFQGRSKGKQEELDNLLTSSGISTPTGREGSQLAISLLCNIALGTHPVEALRRANLDVISIRKGKGTK